MDAIYTYLGTTYGMLTGLFLMSLWLYFGGGKIFPLLGIFISLIPAYELAVMTFEFETIKMNLYMYTPSYFSYGFVHYLMNYIGALVVWGILLSVLGALMSARNN